MRKLILVVLSVALTVVAGSAQEPKPTVEVRSEYLMTLEASLDPPQVMGARRIVNIPGGTVRGPKINGTIIAPSGDWLHAMPDGSSRLDVRLTIKTDDNELIFVEYGGVVAFSKEASERLSKGEALTHADGYYLTAPRFTTASTKYAWLNHVQAVGKMVSLQRGRGLKYDIFEMR
jgi:hypothetical protein